MSTIHPLFGNPFTFDSTPAAPEMDEATGPQEFALVRRSSAVAPQIDREGVEVIEVTARWGRTVLGVAHVAEGASLSIGEDDHGAILVPEAILGARSFKLLDRGVLTMPQLAKGTLAKDGDAKGAFVAAGGEPVTMQLGMRARMQLGEGESAITITAARVAAARPTPRRGSLKRGIVALVATSLLAHLGIVAALAFTPGAALEDDNTPLDKETTATLASMYNAASIREQPQQDEQTQSTAGQTSGGDSGGRHAGREGTLGTPSAKVNGGAYTIKGPAESPEQHLANVRSLIEQNKIGALGALSSVLGSQGPIDLGNTFDSELGHDASTINGNVVGLHPGESFGNYGLGSFSDGPGGGGWNLDGIGTERIGGFGHGPGSGGFTYGNCQGAECGSSFGPGGGPGGLKHAVQNAHPPVDTYGGDVTGGLPSEIVRRTVRANFPRFGQCYDLGLKKDPGLSGTVKASFIIDTTGAVETVSIVQGVADPAVNACVAGVYQTMSFPAVDNGGKSRVLYPIDFESH